MFKVMRKTVQMVRLASRMTGSMGIVPFQPFKTFIPPDRVRGPFKTLTDQFVQGSRFNVQSQSEAYSNRFTRSSRSNRRTEARPKCSGLAPRLDPFRRL